MHTNRYEATVKANGEFPVFISYSPTSLGMEKSSLTLRTINGSTKYVIPLAGYGGTSNLDISGPKLVNGEFVLDMGQISLGQKKIMTLLIRNSGLRASFVALKCFSGTGPCQMVTFSTYNYITLCVEKRFLWYINVGLLTLVI